MTTKAKVIVPNKVWILEDQGIKIGTLNKEKSGFSFFRKGVKITLNNLNEVKNHFGSDLFNDLPKIKRTEEPTDNIYGFPCAKPPYNPVYNLRKHLPIYAKSLKSKSLYCAGYYIIQFRKGWVKSFCPKLITLERYPFKGPFKTQEEQKQALCQANQQ